MTSYRPTPPPVPAPYLANLPSLDDVTLKRIEGFGRPTDAELVEARRVFGRLRQLIREARSNWESENCVVVVPEEGFFG